MITKNLVDTILLLLRVFLYLAHFKLPSRSVPLTVAWWLSLGLGSIREDYLFDKRASIIDNQIAHFSSASSFSSLIPFRDKTLTIIIAQPTILDRIHKENQTLTVCIVALGHG